MFKYPIIGLSPIDGVTDVVFRQLVDECSQPDVLYTEFVPVDGLIFGKPAVYKMLLRHKTNVPIFAQLLGNDPDLFYTATIIALTLGFDGIDINMGCPDKNVFKKGSGAALILNPSLAQKIILNVKKAVDDWTKGIDYQNVSLNQEALLTIKLIRTKQKKTKRKIVPVSVKTRTGYQKHSTKKWLEALLEVKPDIITIHGRTFTQRYSGKADWEQIAIAADLAKDTNTKIFGNGDIKNIDEAKTAIKKYKVAGVLIGRAAFGNPWIFGNHNPSIKERLGIMNRHCQLFHQYLPNGNFKSLRKHFVWYAKTLPCSAQLKNQLMKAEKTEDVKKIIKNFS